jgi:isoleucyl-tRNA synthetase
MPPAALPLLLQGLLSALAPLVPHMAEDAWLNLPAPSKAAASSSNGSSGSSSGAESVFLAGWSAPQPQWGSMSQQELACWAALPAVREAFTKTMEAARAGKAIGSTQEAAVALHVSEPRLAAWLQQLNAAGNAADELRYLLITSEVALVGSAEEAAAGALASSSVDTGADVAGVVTVGVRRAGGSKCARCWMYSTQVGGQQCAAAAAACVWGGCGPHSAMRVGCQFYLFAEVGWVGEGRAVQW